MRPVFVVALACAAFLGALGLVQMRRQLADAKADAASAAEQSARLSATLEEQLPWMRKQLQQQSRTLQKLSEELTQRQAAGNFAHALAEEQLDDAGQLEQIWAALEPFAEQHLEGWEKRKQEDARLRMEEAMAEMRERRIQELAEKLGLNPFQTEQVARIREEFENKRRDLLPGEDLSSFDPRELVGRMKQLKEEEHDQLARVLTPEQLDQYTKSGSSVRVFTTEDGGMGMESISISADFLGEPLQFSLPRGDEEGAAIEAGIEVRRFGIDSGEGPPGATIITDGGEAELIISPEPAPGYEGDE